MLVGSKGGSGGSFVQKPDNLRSTDTFEGLLGLVAGPIKGPVDGLKSIRINGTPVEDVTGKANFDGVTSFFADGDPLKFPQKPVLKLGSAGAPDSVGTQLRNTTGTGVWTTASLTNLNANAIDLRFIVNQLYRQDKKGIFTHTANLEIQMKPSGSATWINPFNGQNGSTTYPPYEPRGYDVNLGIFGLMRYMIQEAVYDSSYGNFTGGSSTNVGSGPYLTITGKTTSPFVKELRIEVPNTGAAYANKGWDIRCRLVEKESVDNDPNFEKRNVTWESLTAVYTTVLGDHEDWRALSWLQVYGTASDNFNGVPEVEGIYDLKIVSVPPTSVFNPDTRVYTGTIWDGSWAKAWTTDPAWIINDAISDSINGIAAFVPGAHLNKWDALELSKWCSELVPDGKGGTHPRFSLNLYVDQPQKSDEFIRYLAGSCGATVWDNGGGEWRMAVDRPQVPVDLFTSETIEGEFQYSHTDVDTRFNDVTVVFINEEFDFREDRVRLVNQPDIDKNGRKPTKVVGIGITNRQQAIRWAVLRLRTNVNEFRAVSFTTNRRGKLLERFNTILIADGSLNTDMTDGEIRSTGRIIQNKGGSIVVRDTMRLEIGVSYTLHFTVPNPDYNPDPTGQPTTATWQLPTLAMTRSVTNTAAQRGNVTEFFLDSPLPADVAENANVALEAVGLPAIPTTFRIMDLDFAEDGERVTINAMQVDTGKWDAADNADETALDLALPAFEVPPPTAPAAGVWSLGWFTSEFSKIPVLTAKWERPALAIFDYYKLDYRINDGPWQDLGTTRENFYEFQQPQFGKYEIRVCAVARRKNVSLPLTASYELLEYQLFPPVGYLTNETHTVAAAADGTGFDLTGSGGLFVLNYQLGNISSGVTYSVVSETGCDVSIDPATGIYTVNSLVSDQGKATFRAEWQGFMVDKEYSITKSKAGVTGGTGPGGPVIAIAVDTQGFTFLDGVASPASQTITLSAIQQNTSEAVVWSVSPAVTLGGTGLTRTLDLTAFGSNRQVTVTVTGQTTGVIDKITLVRLDLSTAAAGATVGATWDSNLDGIPDNLAALTGAEFINNAFIPLGQNQVCNSDFLHTGDYLYGWSPGWDGNSGITPTRGVNLAGWFGALNVAYTWIAGTPASGKVFDGHNSYALGDPTALATMQRWAVPVKDGDVCFASALVGAHRCTAYVEIEWRDANGAYLNEAGGTAGGRDGGGANGDPNNFDRLGCIATAPTGARYAVMRVRGLTNGSSNPYIFYTQMMLSKIPSGQTAWPVYGPGPSDKSATYGAMWDTNLDGIPDNLAVLVGTEVINNQVILDAIAADNVLSRTEKLSLMKVYNDLEARYVDLRARAAAAGISVSTLDSARSDFRGCLGSYSPAWNKLDQDTTIWTNRYFQPGGSVNILGGGWEGDGPGLSTSVSGAYTTLTDSDTSSAVSGFYRDAPCGGSEQWSVGTLIKKRTVGNSVGFRILFYGGAGPVQHFDMLVNQATGEIYYAGGSKAADGYAVYDVGDDLFICSVLTGAADNAAVRVEIYPAANNNTVGGFAPGCTGDVQVKNAVLAKGWTYALGRMTLSATQYSYGRQMQAIAKAISERDGTTGLVINNVDRVDIAADPTGTVKASQLPKNVALSASVGTAVVTTLGTWSLGTLPDGVTATIGAGTGILSITAYVASEGVIPVTFVYNGVTRTLNVPTKRVDDPATNAGSSGGGTTVTTTTLADTNGANTYGTGISAELIAKAGTGGQVACSAPINYVRNNQVNIGRNQAYGKWQWTTVGSSSWTDIAAEVAASTASRTIDAGDGTISTLNGNISVNHTKTGLTPGTDYKFRFVWREVLVSGTNSPVSRVSGTMQAAGS